MADAYTVGSDATITIAAGETANASDTAAISAGGQRHRGGGPGGVTVTGSAGNAQGIGQVTGASLTLEDDDAGPVPRDRRTANHGLDQLAERCGGGGGDDGDADLHGVAGRGERRRGNGGLRGGDGRDGRVGTDYTAPASATLTFAAGDTSRSIAVSVTGDTTDEPDETVVVTLGNASGATIGTGTGTGTITDDDAAPTVTLALADDSISENGGATTVSATLSHPSSAATTITISPVADAYTVGADDTITIPAGDTANASDTAAITAVDNATDEANRSVTVTGSASNAQGAGSVTGAGLTLIDDDGQPSLTINAPSVAEGDSGSASLTWTVTLSPAGTEAVTVDYAEGTGGTAESGTDYTAPASGTLTFAVGDTSRSITVSVTGDTTDEPDETVVVTLGNASGATIGTGTGTGTITDDDAAPTVTLSLADDSIPENGGATTVSATLSHPSSEATTITIAALANAYTVGSDATITIAAGDTANASDTAAINAVDNDTGEADRSVTVTGSAGNTQGIGQVTGASLTLEDDDGGSGPTGPSDDEPTMSIDSPSVAEGAAGTTATLTFTVSLSAASAEAVTVAYAAATGGTATAGTDYAAPVSGTLTIAAGDTGATIAVTVIGDGVDEPDETILMTLGEPAGATLGTGTGTGTGTITDDDAAPTVTLSLADDSIPENGGATTVSATLGNASSEATTITIAALADAYTVGADDTITIPAGDTANASDTVTITAVDNATDEANRSVTVTGSASNTQGAGPVTGAGLTLLDDDGEPSLTINAPGVTEGDSGSASLIYTVTLSPASGGEVTVDYAEGTGGTATSGTDYTAPASGTLTFAAGDTSKTITVSVTGDTTDEPDETVVVTLGDASGATIGTASGTGTIRDDDAAPTVTLSLADDSIPENGGSTIVSATLSHPSSAATTITISPVADAYTVGSDATISIAAGDTANASDTAAINAVDNDTGEADRSVTVTGSAGNAQGIGRVTGASLTLEDDDGQSSLTINAPSVTEGDGGSASLIYTVTLSPASGGEVTVGYAEGTGGTAASGTDYAALTAGTLTFAAGDTSRTITVSVTGDTTDEPDETVVVTLGNASGAAVGTASGTGTIRDDDAAPTVTLAVADDSISENGGATTVSATLSHPSSAATTITISALGDVYTVGPDATITIPAGETANASDTATISAVDNDTGGADHLVIVIGSASNAQGIGPVTGAVLTIGDDDGGGSGPARPQDALPVLSIYSPSVTEGDSASVALHYTVTLSAASAGAVTVRYAEGTGGTATAGTDYTALASGTLTFAAGETSRTITVSVIGDTTDEPNETVVVVLSSPAGATIGIGTGTGTITDNEPFPYLRYWLADDLIPENGGTTTVSATLNRPSSAATTITILPVAGHYTVGSDATITIAAGQTANASDTATITAVDNTTDDANNRSEALRASISNALGVQGIQTRLTLIDDDNVVPSFTINSPQSVTEGDSGSTSLIYTVTMTPGSSSESVRYEVTGTATAGTDYTGPTSGSLIWTNTRPSKTITVPVTGDTADEPDETVVVTLKNPSYGTTLDSASARTVTINDDDAAPTSITLTVDDDAVGEGDGATTITVTATVDGTTQFGERHPVFVSVSGSGTATAVDFPSMPSVSIPIAAGAASGTRTFTLTPTDDAVDETDETITLTGFAQPWPPLGLSNRLRVNPATITLTDDDAAPTSITLTVDDDSVGEGDSAGTITVTAAVDGTTRFATAKTVRVSVSGSVTTGAVDFAAVPAFDIEIAAEAASGTGTFTLTPTNDTEDETDETITVSGAETGGLTVNPDTITLTDDDGTPTLSINSPSVTEGDSGSANLTFTVSLSPAAAAEVTVDYSDAGTGTATSGTDYTALTTGTLTFAPGTTSQTFDVSVTGDLRNELNETVGVSLGNANANATISTSAGTGTITDDDGVPTVSISSPSVSEGDSGTATLSFTVSLSAASGRQVTVGYSDAGTGTATSGTDYTALTAGTLTFEAGQTSKTITVAVRGDATDEPNETVKVSLGSATNAKVSPSAGTGTGTITDDDVVLSINSPRVDEGDSGMKNLTFTVSLSSAAAAEVTVRYSDAGTGTATSGTDYTALPAGMLAFAPGVTSRTITVSVTGDVVPEANETVKVRLDNPTNAKVSSSAGTGTGTITNNDGAPVLSISSPSVTEGDSGTASLTFTVSLSAASGSRVTVAYSDAGTGTATLESRYWDYTILRSGTLTFAAGETSKTITVSVRGDLLDEVDETVEVSLGSATNATVSSSAGVGTGTITDDDNAPVLRINSPSVSEGNSGHTNLDFTVTPDAVSGKQMTVDYDDRRTGTATISTDYEVLAPGTLTFAAGETSKTITVRVAGDTTDEVNETLGVRLRSATNARIRSSASVGTGTITDDDGLPVLSINSPSVTEPDAGLAGLHFTVSLTPASGKQVTVGYHDPRGGTATSASDYDTLATGSLTFAPGETSKRITVYVWGDLDEEPNETIQVSISNLMGYPLTNATVGTGHATGTITDNDGLPTVILGLSSTAISEQSGTATVSATLSRASLSPINLTINPVAGDYRVGHPATMEFLAGNTSTSDTVTITAVDDVTEGNGRTTRVIGTAYTWPDDVAVSVSGVTLTLIDDDKFNITVYASPPVLEGETMNFTLVRTPVPTTPTWFRYRTSNGTAISPGDYTHTAVTERGPHFASGESRVVITVPVNDDGLDEGIETFHFRVSNLSGHTGIAPRHILAATGQILDNDEPPTVSISSSNVSATEGDTSGLEWTVSLDAASGKRVSVTYSDEATATATPGTDHTASTGRLVHFSPGETSKSINVGIIQDEIDEPNETVRIILDEATNAYVDSGAFIGTGTIIDDDGAPQFSINSPSVNEGNSASQVQSFTVSLSPASHRERTVIYQEGTGGTATSGTDYTFSAGALTFAAGETSKTLDVQVVGDTTDEPDETVKLNLVGTRTVRFGVPKRGTMTIVDNDSPPIISINSPSVNEGYIHARTDMTFTVNLNAASGKQVSVGYTDLGTGTAVAYSDYGPLTAGTLTFAAGETSKTITVSVRGDQLDEADETVLVGLRNATNATISSSAGTGTGTITNDDDPLPTVSINDPSVNEGDNGTANLTFTVSLSAASSEEVTVGYSDAGTGTATSGTDYTALTAGTLTFAAGDTSKTITVSVTGDETDEADKTVKVSLDSAENATISSSAGTGTGTITDDDPLPTVSINSPSADEGDSGTANLTFTVSLSAVSSKEVRVFYSDARTGTATSGTDYTALSGRWLTFAAGDTSKTITVAVRGDTTDEPDETVMVRLDFARNATFSSSAGIGTGTITDDDAVISIDDPSVNEGDSSTANLTFTVSLNKAIGKRVTVDYSDAGTGTATSGEDYTALTMGTLAFAAGDTSKTITVSVTGDTKDEPNETVAVTLSGAANATIRTATGTGTITDDDDAPELSINDPSVTEGNSGSATLRFTVSLDAASGKEVEVDYSDAGTGTATSGTDYTAITGGTLTIAAGTTSQTFDVSVTGDETDEADETVKVSLSRPTNATISSSAGTGTGTITDNDDAPELSINDPSVTEGDTGSVNLVFTVSLDEASGKEVEVDYSDAGTGTATSGTDYTAITGGTLTIAAGTTSQTFDVSVTGDALDEADETVKVSLGSPKNATISSSAGTGTGTITDNDDAPELSINDPSVTEGNSGSVTLTFTVSLDEASGKEVEVDYSDAGTGTATSGTDYTAITGGTLTIAAGTTSQTFDVSVTGDETDEADETVKVSLSRPTNATISSSAGTGTGTITDNDDAPELSINDPSVTEGDTGSVNLVFTVSLDEASGKEVEVDYSDAGTGTATSGTDYTAITGGTLTIAAGTTSQTFDVSVTGDETDEADETVKVSLGSPMNATISSSAGTGTGTITDNDDAPTVTLSLSPTSIAESGATTVTASLDHASSQVTTVTVSAAAGTNAEATDFTVSSNKTLTIAAGLTASTGTVTITAVDNSEDEPDKSVTVSGSAANGQGITDPSDVTLTITDDDAEPVLSINSPSVREGDSGTADLEFTVSLSAASGQEVTVAYAEGTGGTATSGTDYTALTGGTLTFAAGVTSRTITVSVTGDTTDEANETVKVSLGSVTNATVSSSAGTGDGDDHGRRRGADGDASAGGRFDPGERGHDDGIGDAGQPFDRGDHDQDRAGGGGLHGGFGHDDHHRRRADGECLGHGDDHGGGRHGGHGEPERHGNRLGDQRAGRGFGKWSGPDADRRRRGFDAFDQQPAGNGG